MNVYLLRHGIAVPSGTPGIPDHDRPLTPEGRKKVAQVAHGFERLALAVDRIVTSPLPRALATAEIIADALGMEDRLEVDDALSADRSADSIAVWLGKSSESSVMLVGHNPGLSDLIGVLTGAGGLGDACSLRRGGMAALSRGSGGAYLLDWLARPRILRRLGRQ